MPQTFLIATATAFLALVILIMVLAANSIIQLNHNRQLNTDVQLHNRKVELITQIQVASHQRTDSLLRMALTSDAFDRDAIHMEFDHAAVHVSGGRSALKVMGFTPAERIEFDRQTRLVMRIQERQEKVLDLLNIGRVQEANTKLKQEVIPLQNAFNQQLVSMRKRYQDDTLRAQIAASKMYDDTLRLTIALGISAGLLGVTVGWVTLRRLFHICFQIDRQFKQLETSRAALKREATHDSLTGLANRRLFYDRLQQAIHHARRYDSKVGLLFIDLDRFKEINDRHGHHIGDAVLTEVAQRLSRSVRESDSIARIGGDEFVVLLGKVHGREDCLIAALGIERALAENNSFYGLALEISASIGQALFPDDGEDEDALIRAADAAMYCVKGHTETDRQHHFVFAQ